MFPWECSKFLCKKSKVLHLLNQTIDSDLAFERAVQIAKEMDVSQDSELIACIENAQDFRLSIDWDEV